MSELEFHGDPGSSRVLTELWEVTLAEREAAWEELLSPQERRQAEAALEAERERRGLEAGE